MPKLESRKPMRRFSLLFPAVLVLTFAGSRLQAQDRLTLFGGYSYLRPSLIQTRTFVCPPGQDCHIVNRPVDENSHPSLRGWEVSATYRVWSWLGVKADFSRHYGTALAGSSADVSTCLFGFEVRRPGRLSPFAHVLFGVAHESTSEKSIAIWIHNTLLGTSATAFAMALGGGLDIRVVSVVSIRAIEVDYLRARFAPDPNPYLHPGGHPRLSAGLALHF
jgi:hypothetical protein